MQPEPTKICPNAHCQAPMVKQTQHNVTIDICPRDGAIALDAGELPLIVSQVSGTPGYNPIPPQHYNTHRAAYRENHGHHGRRRHGDSGGFLDELFDGS